MKKITGGKGKGVGRGTSMKDVEAIVIKEGQLKERREMIGGRRCEREGQVGLKDQGHMRKKLRNL